MKCPYCSESILDEAVVCVHCRRDLLFFKPIREEITELERRITDLAQGSRQPKRSGRPKLAGDDIAPMIAILLGTVLSFTITWIDWRPNVGTHYDWLFQSFAIAAPFFPAYVLARWFRTMSGPVAACLGVTAGILGYIAMMVLYGMGKLNEAFAKSRYFIPLPDHWPWSLLFYIALGALFFYVGAKLGHMHAGTRGIETRTGDASPAGWFDNPTFLTVIGFLSLLVKNFDSLKEFVQYLRGK